MPGMKVMPAVIGFLLWLSCFAASLQAKQTTYVIGIEDINYYPHYDFTGDQPRGYFYDLMQLFSQKSGYQFRFQKLPVKRLYLAAKDDVDFVYPDNPKWQPYLHATFEKIYSEPLIYTLGSTMVRSAHRELAVANVKSLAIIHGFTPFRWLELKKLYNFRIVDVPDVDSALGLLLKDRVDAAVIEYNVANAFLKAQQRTGELVFGENLPFTEVPFLLSTIKHQSVISEFNQFMRSEKSTIRQLKTRYGLIEHKTELGQIPLKN